jgi:L-lactate dehydrogenase complex protein LldG
VPGEVARFLTKNNLPMVLKVAPEISEKIIPWTDQAILKVGIGRANGTDNVCVSRAFAGVAETGTLVVVSGRISPTTLNFLPVIHICLVHASKIAGDYEEVWTRIRAENQEADTIGFMPRTVNWITGPSRTADIEQTLLLGAHGPQRLHIVIVDD